MSYSRKQAGVIYRAVKEGKLEMAKDAISRLYDFVGCPVETPYGEAVYYAVKVAVNAIFDNDYKVAQTAVSNI